MDIYARIRQVAFELVSEGEWPTVVEVRARLGTGSNTTINNTLKQWRQEFLARNAAAVKRPDWPPALADAFGQLWQKACEVAEGNLATLREEVEQKLQQVVAELAAAQRELDDRAAQLVSLSGELAQQRERGDALQQQLAEANSRRQVLEDSLAGLTASLDDARAQTLLVQKDADERVAALEQRQEERLQQAAAEAAQREALAYERFEGMRVRLYEQVEAERAQMKQQATQQAAQLTSLSAQLDEVRRLRQQQEADTARELGKAAAQQELAASRLAELEARCDSLRQQDEARQAQMLGLAAQASSAQTELQILREQRLPQWQQLVLLNRDKLAAMPEQEAAKLVAGWLGLSVE
ncbi:DNA-binding protein [Vogesella urethralis]|uniref:DNA-binding protein n=1 Tax=Vogesella urethralis TaxID=2592656 RepID=UPI0014788BA8|nr:DNA-binding protein [Vogesella urethralis]